MRGAPIPPCKARPLAMGLVLAVGVSLTTCKLDKLIHPTTADRLTVSPRALTDSAHVGSSGDHTLRVFIQNADGPTLGWTATKSAVWVELAQYSGSTPDSVDVIIHPDTLSQTLHQDTIVFASTQTNDSVRVPLRFSMLPAAAELAVDTTSRLTTAFVGNAQPDTFSLQIKNPGALPLTWTATFDTTWVTLSDSGSTVPPNDVTSTVVLATLRPAGLAVGTHRSTIAFAAPGASGSPDSVHVRYTIIPCVEKTITPDVIDTSAIALNDCGAPQRPGRQAKLYAVQANTGDTLSFRLTAAFNPWLIVTNSSGATVLDSVDVCGAANTACIVNFPVTVTGRYVIEATTRDSGETGAFTLSAVKERAPTLPQGIQQLRGDSATPIGNGLITPESAAVFRGTVNDQNPRDSVRLEIELLETSSAFTGPSNFQSAYVGAGQTAWIRVTGLRDNAPYHWRAQTCDKTLRCSGWLDFGNPDPAVDFYVNWNPEDPAVPTSIGQFTAGGASIAVGGNSGGGSVVLSGTISDPDPGDQVRLEVEAVTVGTTFNNTATNASAFGAPNRIASATGPATILFSYHWQVRTCDQTGRCSAWVSFPQPTPNPETSADYVGSL